jgi:ketosteroid isomerase-like protein
MKEIKKEVEAFLKSYETATNTHDFSNVKKLLSEDLVYWFSDGSFNSINDLERAFVSTWNKIQDEDYSINDVKWISLENNSAVCIYQFKWKGLINGKLQQGKGRGTNVLVKKNSKWYMIHEHLSTL